MKLSDIDEIIGVYTNVKYNHTLNRFLITLFLGIFVFLNSSLSGLSENLAVTAAKIAYFLLFDASCLIILEIRPMYQYCMYYKVPEILRQFSEDSENCEESRIIVISSVQKILNKLDNSHFALNYVMYILSLMLFILIIISSVVLLFQ